MDKSLCLADRTAVACMFLPPPMLAEFLEHEADRCEREGNLEGIVILGMGPRGINMLEVCVCQGGEVGFGHGGLRNGVYYTLEPRLFITQNDG